MSARRKNTPSGNFVCTVCGNSTVATRDQFSESVEYRRLDSKERLHRRQTRLVCRACVLEIKGDHVEELPLFSFSDEGAGPDRFTH